MITGLAAAAFLGALVGMALPAALGPWLSRMGVIDVPNDRSSHSTPVVRGAGIAPSLSLATGLVIILQGLDLPWGQAGWTLLVALTSSIAAAVLGWTEDHRGLPIKQRLLAQVVIGGVATTALIVAYGTSWTWLLLGAVVFAAYVNIANFMDGIDGMSGAHGGAVGASFAVVGAMTHIDWLVAAGVLLGVAFMSFLPWNLIRGRMFLGDVGSYLLGGAISVVSIAAVFGGVPLITIVAPMSIYLADTGSTLIRRILKGERWYEAHRSHVYQRLTDTGLSHVAVTSVTVGFTCLSAAFGLLSLLPTWWAGSASAVGLVAAVCCYLRLPKWLASDQVRHLAGGGAALVSKSDLAPETQQMELMLTESNSERWAVVGATGFIGSALLTKLRADGINVLPIRAPRLELEPDEARRGSAENKIATGELAAQFMNVDVVVNAAGLATPDSEAAGALYGANALLPVVIADAAARAGCRRYIHLSSAAVQGRRSILDESAAVAPFSPYSESKAIAERELLVHNADKESRGRDLEIIIVRATSVQGAGRKTTVQLQKLARSPLASVASPGDHPTVVSSLNGLVDFVSQVGSFKGKVPRIVLQPWEGMTTREVLLHAGGREPTQLPASLCARLISIGYLLGRLSARVSGTVRRMELMWFGQRQDASWSSTAGVSVQSAVRQTLSPDISAS